MADLNLPSISELGQMQFLPAAQRQMARDNINLANQFQQQNLQSGELSLQKSLMDNLFQQQNDPTKLRLNNSNADIAGSEAILKKADADIRQRFMPDEIEAKRNAFIKKKSEDELAALYTRAEKDYADPATPPEKREAAKEVLSRTMKELHERLKAKDTQDNTRITADAHIKGAEIAAGASKYGADARERSAAATAASRQKIAGTVQERIMGAKTPDAQAAIYDGAAEQAQLAGDDTMADAYKQKAAYARAVSVQNRTATAGVQQGGKIDMGTAANTGAIQNQPNPVTTPTAPNMPRRNSQMERPQPVSGPTNAGERQMQGDAMQTVLPNGADPRTVTELKNTQALLATGQLSPPDAEVARKHVAWLQNKLRMGGGEAAPAPKPAAAPQAPAGRVVIYKDGKAVGSIPQGQVDEAVKQGYSLK